MARPASKRIPRVRPKQRIRAEHHNAIARALEESGGIVAGRGISVAPIKGGVRVSTTEGRRDFWGRITAVHGASGTEPVTPSDVRYSAATDDGTFAIQQAEPRLGRPVRNDEVSVWPARVGDACKIVRLRKADGGVDVHLWVMTEVVANGPCPPPGGGGGGGEGGAP